jgi:hypothetical protein
VTNVHDVVEKAPIRRQGPKLGLPDVAVRIDEAGRQDHSLCIDHLGRSDREVWANGGDFAAFYQDVGDGSYGGGRNRHHTRLPNEKPLNHTCSPCCAEQPIAPRLCCNSQRLETAELREQPIYNRGYQPQNVYHLSKHEPVINTRSLSTPSGKWWLSTRPRGTCSPYRIDFLMAKIIWTIN